MMEVLSATGEIFIETVAIVTAISLTLIAIFAGIRGVSYAADVTEEYFKGNPIKRRYESEISRLIKAGAWERDEKEFVIREYIKEMESALYLSQKFALAMEMLTEIKGEEVWKEIEKNCGRKMSVEYPRGDEKNPWNYKGLAKERNSW